MIRRLITTVAVGALSFAVYVATGGAVAEQTADLADAGYVTPDHEATCPVRLDDDYAADAGVGIYQRVTFPVILTELPDGGRDVQMPPLPQQARLAIDVMSWDDCTLAASTASVRALWGTEHPFTTEGVVSPWCRAKFDAGLPCLLLDGGSFGDRNVSPCSLRIAEGCERVSGGSAIAGDDPEDL